MLATFSNLLPMLTLALAGIAAISLSVAGIGIMNVMLVSVSERTREIGLLKALGATSRQILALFLAEAATLSAAGGVSGLAGASVDHAGSPALYPALPVQPPPWAIPAAVLYRWRSACCSASFPRAARPTRSDRGAEPPVSGHDCHATCSARRVRGPAHRLRSSLTTLGIVIGIASVMLLTSLGEGTRQYILSEFTQFGTNLLQINPGKTTTRGMPNSMGWHHSEADARGRRGDPTPAVVSSASCRWRSGRPASKRAPQPQRLRLWGRRRCAATSGSSRSRSAGSCRRRTATAASLSPSLAEAKRELFGDANALGVHVRIGGRRLQVIGVMEPRARCSASTSTTPRTSRSPRRSSCSTGRPHRNRRALQPRRGESDPWSDGSASRAHAAPRQRRGLHDRDADPDARHRRSHPRHRQPCRARDRGDLAPRRAPLGSSRSCGFRSASAPRNRPAQGARRRAGRNPAIFLGRR